MKTAFVILAVLLAGTAVAQHRVFYVNSYHAGYIPSDQIQAALETLLDSPAYHLTTTCLNAKRADADGLQQNARLAWAAFVRQKPALLIVSDDNAMESFVVPHLADIACPILFCAINWSAERYNLPASKATGMLEILPVQKCIEVIQNAGWPVNSITVLSEASVAENKNKAILIPRFEKLGLSCDYNMVEDFEAWKQAFKSAQRKGNVIFLPTNGSIRNWRDEAATRWVLTHAEVPVFSCDDFMVQFAAFGYTKVAAEQGQYVGNLAKKILAGEGVIDHPVVTNRQFNCLCNDSIAARIGFRPSHECKPVSYAK